MPHVNLWAAPGGLEGPDAPAQNSVCARLSGTSKADKCRGDVVVAKESKVGKSATYVRVEAVADGASGWMTTMFVGPDFDRGACATMFAGQDAAMKRCRGF